MKDLRDQLERRGIACRTCGDAQTMVSGVSDDSRRIDAGDLFVAMPGHRTQGAKYIADALAAGAVAVACAPGQEPDGASCLLIDDVAAAAGPIAAVILGEPSERLELVGVTGTNGKTSIAHLIEHVYLAAGTTCGLAGTVVERWPGVERGATMTTLPAVPLQKMLAEMAAAGCRSVVFEVSSHALAQHRVAGCRFRAAVFTNLTRDHLDYHGDEESYFQAKARLFQDYLEPDAAAVINVDDPWGARLAAGFTGKRLWRYSVDGEDAEGRVLAVEGDLERTRVSLEIAGRRLRVESRLVGRVNVANLLAAATAALALGLDPEAVEAGLSACPPVPGRLERVGDGRPVVLVDYAHTPDALERALAALGRPAGGRLIVCFGCGGDRDRGKRPMMGAVAAAGADLVVLTSDNPRSENPERIIADIEEGCRGRMERIDRRAAAAGGSGYLVEPDREAAIALAIEVAGERDLVLVAGKGHENYQEVAGRRRPFDDRKVVRRLLEER